jgi:predicted transcriptional regulator
MKDNERKKQEGDPTESNPNPRTVLVTDYMTRVEDLITFTPETEILEVVNTLIGQDITGAPVLNDKKELVGLIDDKDCLRVLFDSSYHNQPVSNRNVGHYMSNVMKTISSYSDIHTVADTFLNSIYKRLLVIDDEGRLVGQISRHDILRAIHDFNTNPR